MDPKSKETVLFIKQTWGFSVRIYSDKARMNMIMEARYKKGTAFAWDIYEGEKFLGTVSSSLFATVAKMGSEVMKITDQSGREVLTFEREKNAVLKQIVDSMIDIYNPTHNYKILSPDGKTVAEIRGKHGIFKSFYDFECQAGTEEQKKLALAVFCIMAVSLKK